MRIFQNSGLYPSYIPRLRRITQHCGNFKSHISAFLNDRFGATHFLEPILSGSPTAFFTNGDDKVFQRLWAKENGLPLNSTLEKILLTQIEHHRTEVFYNMDPMRYGSSFVRKLPSCVRKTIAWRAAPSLGADFGAYDLIVCNFPSILDGYRQQGWRADYFFPAHDPEMDSYAENTSRPVDVLFVGGYSRHHKRRVQLLEAVAGLKQHHNIVLHLDQTRLTRLAESPIGYLLPLAGHRRPAIIQSVSKGPIFGRELYAALSNAKIVLNGSIDMAGRDRGNMRCFEAMGCGALMVSDEGHYPADMASDRTMLTWHAATDILRIIPEILHDETRRTTVARRGYQMISEVYSKQRQWERFTQLVS